MCKGLAVCRVSVVYGHTHTESTRTQLAQRFGVALFVVLRQPLPNLESQLHSLEELLECDKLQQLELALSVYTGWSWLHCYTS